MASFTDTYKMRYAAVGPISGSAHTVNSSLSSAQTLTVPAGAQAIIMQALTQNIRFTLEGTTPTASVGFQLAAGDMLMIDIAPGMTVKAIEETASAALQYQWVKYAQ